MKKIWFFAVVFLNAGIAFSHPGHGRHGWFHAHADLLADIALIFFAASVLVALCRGLGRLVFK
jgi:hypothetical protein